MSNQNLNGSVDLLADAMRQVFQECMDGTRDAIKDDLGVVVEELGDIEGRLNDRIDTLGSKFDTVSGKTDHLADRIDKQLLA